MEVVNKFLRGALSVVSPGCLSRSIHCKALLITLTQSQHFRSSLFIGTNI